MTREQLRYQERITQDPNIMVGKPVVKGTRIPVELVLQHLEETPDLEDLFAAFPNLTMEDVKACFAYARAVMAHARKTRHKQPGVHAAGA